MDILDQADETQAAFMRASLAAVPAPTAHEGIGVCLNCSAPVEGSARWCDAECRADWEVHGRK